MGGSRFDADAYSGYSRATRSKPVSGANGVFKSARMDAGLDPAKVKVASGPLAGMAVRESRDSDANPKSTPVIIMTDVTGSMGRLGQIIVTGLGDVMKEIYDTKPVTDPHIMLGAIGDADAYDTAPLQVTQFEAGNEELITQLEKIFVEGGGGGNSFESYHLAWLFAAMKTVSDCNEKRNEKGFLFTIGDEYLAKMCTVASVRKVFGETLGLEQDLDVSDVLAMAQRKYHVFHLVVAHEDGQFYDNKETAEGMINGAGAARGYGGCQPWGAVMGQNVIPVKDYHAISDVIIGTMRSMAGHSMDDILKGRSDSTALVVADALKNLPTKGSAGAGASGLVAL